MAAEDQPTGQRRIAVSGASGLVGGKLSAALAARGDEVVPMVRSDPQDGEIYWNAVEGTLDPAALEGIDAVVHLAGENIAGGRWNDERKRRIRDSRVDGTTLVAEAITKVSGPPPTLVCASATGYYGDRGDTILDEGAEPGTGFLPDVCRAWEAACGPARAAGARVVNLRLGMILAKEDGALAKMLTPFKCGVGGVVGSGKQFWSWISIDDVVGVILHALDSPDVQGPVNTVSPNAVTNREFTKTLGRVLSRPTILPLPGFAARLVLGEMANDLLLASLRVTPRELAKTGYEFAYPDLEAALRHVLDR